MNSRDDHKKLLDKFHAYFVNLARTDLNKLNERFPDFIEITKNVEMIKPNLDAKTYAAIVMDLQKICQKGIENFQGKGGKQTYATLLQELSRKINTANITELRSAYDGFNDKTRKAFNTQLTGTINKLEKYQSKIDDAIREAQNTSLLFQKVNVFLSSQKSVISEKLYNTLLEREHDDDLTALAIAVLQADATHQEILKGTTNKAKRLGEIITELKNLFKDHYPILYAQAKTTKQQIPLKK